MKLLFYSFIFSYYLTGAFTNTVVADKALPTGVPPEVVVKAPPASI